MLKIDGLSLCSAIVAAPLIQLCQVVVVAPGKAHWAPHFFFKSTLLFWRDSPKQSRSFLPPLSFHSTFFFLALLLLLFCFLLFLLVSRFEQRAAALPLFNFSIRCCCCCHVLVVACKLFVLLSVQSTVLYWTLLEVRLYSHSQMFGAKTSPRNRLALTDSLTH